jgi:hypothetical protein
MEQSTLNLDNTLMDAFKLFVGSVATLGWSGTAIVFIYLCSKNGWKLPWVKNGGIVLGPVVTQGELTTSIQIVEKNLKVKIDETYKKLAEKIDRRAVEQKLTFSKHEQDDDRRFTKLQEESTETGNAVARIEGYIKGRAENDR